MRPCSRAPKPGSVTRHRSISSSAPVVLQLPDALQPDELRAQEFLSAGAVMAEGLVNLLDAFAHRPLWLEGRQARSGSSRSPRDSCERRGWRRPAIRDLGARNDLCNHLRDVADAIVLRGNSDVECLVVHELPRAPPEPRRRRAQISSMCTSGRHGMPSLLMSTSPVVQAYPTRLLTTRSPRSRDETPKAVALRRKVGLNASSASRRDVTLHPHLALGVRRHRIESRALVQEIVAGGAVVAAGGGEDDTAARRPLSRGSRGAPRPGG